MIFIFLNFKFIILNLRGFTEFVLFSLSLIVWKIPARWDECTCTHFIPLWVTLNLIYPLLVQVRSSRSSLWRDYIEERKQYQNWCGGWPSKLPCVCLLCIFIYISKLSMPFLFPVFLFNMSLSFYVLTTLCFHSLLHYKLKVLYTSKVVLAALWLDLYNAYTGCLFPFSTVSVADKLDTFVTYLFLLLKLFVYLQHIDCGTICWLLFGCNISVCYSFLMLRFSGTD